jgi:phenylalanyl-tRNA synthetase beta chain
MPRATLHLDRVQSMLPAPLTREELPDLLFPSKVELEAAEGNELRLEGTADRIDLLTEGGLGLYLQGVLGTARGLPDLRPARDPPPVLEVDRSVEAVRPHLAAVLVEPPEGRPLDAGLLDEAIRFQELLDATIGLGRRLASLGIYPMARVEGPVRYALEPLPSVRFTPLDAAGPVEGPAFFEAHPMAARYGAFGRAGDRCLTLRDRSGQILSLPPILNSREAGEARVGDTALLLESTGIRSARVHDSLGLLSLVFVARGWHLTPVPVASPIAPDAPGAAGRTRHIHLPSATLARLAGRPFSDEEVHRLLGRSRLGVERDPTGWRAEVPPWRPDIQASVDVAEDILLAHGVRASDGLLLPSATVGRRASAALFRERAGDLLLGLGCVPVYTPVLVSERLVRTVGRVDTVELANPVSDQFAFLRDALFLSLLGTLARNTGAGYPQRFSEVGPVLTANPGSETGADTRYHAGVFLAEESAGFADAAALVDYVLRSFGVAGVREPTVVPGTIPGRAAAVRLTGELVAEVGEVHPRLLRELHVPVPVAWAEIDLSMLHTLLAPTPGPAPA